MSKTDRIKFIFAEPQQWGLRGDPFLWKELCEHFSTACLPDTSEEFGAQVKLKIKDLTSSDRLGDQPIFVERYDSGGMSSGHVCSDWWMTKGVPLFQRQFLAFQPISETREDCER